jgi:hypothetical protein
VHLPGRITQAIRTVIEDHPQLQVQVRDAVLQNIQEAHDEFLLSNGHSSSTSLTSTESSVDREDINLPSVLNQIPEAQGFPEFPGFQEFPGLFENGMIGDFVYIPDLSYFADSMGHSAGCSQDAGFDLN